MTPEDEIAFQTWQMCDTADHAHWAIKHGIAPEQVAAALASDAGLPLTRVPQSADYQQGFTDGCGFGVRTADRTWADAVATIPPHVSTQAEKDALLDEVCADLDAANVPRRRWWQR